MPSAFAALIRFSVHSTPIAAIMVAAGEQADPIYMLSLPASIGFHPHKVYIYEWKSWQLSIFCKYYFCCSVSAVVIHNKWINKSDDATVHFRKDSIFFEHSGDMLPPTTIST